MRTPQIDEHVEAVSDESGSQSSIDNVKERGKREVNWTGKSRGSVRIGYETELLIESPHHGNNDSFSTARHSPPTVKLKNFTSLRVLTGACRARRIPRTHKAFGPPIRQFTYTSRIANMATVQLDDKVKSLITKAHPQANEDDPIKLSATLFPNAEVKF